MKPTEDPSVLKFLKSVFDSEKNALNEEIIRLSKSTFEISDEEANNKNILSKLKIRLTLITEYERSDPAHFLIESKNVRFICPRCLVHNNSKYVLTNDSLMTSGTGVWLCGKCGLRYNSNTPNDIPTASVPKSED
jgi:ribosomal protein S27AE